MLVGLVDVDNFANLEGCFPNIPLMKLSTWHKNNGDIVEWHNQSVLDGTYFEHINDDALELPELQEGK